MNASCDQTTFPQSQPFNILAPQNIFSGITAPFFPLICMEKKKKKRDQVGNFVKYIIIYICM